MRLKVTGSGIIDVNDNTLLGVNSDGSVSGVTSAAHLPQWVLDVAGA